MNWKLLRDTKQLDEIFERSVEKPQLIFKHSTRCGISAHVLSSFEAEYKIDEGSLEPYLLDLISFRNISNEISERTGVMHQSPQVILIKNGKSIFNASHQGITVKKVEEYLN